MSLLLLLLLLALTPYDSRTKSSIKLPYKCRRSNVIVTRIWQMKFGLHKFQLNQVEKEFRRLKVRNGRRRRCRRRRSLNNIPHRQRQRLTIKTKCRRLSVCLSGLLLFKKLSCK